jgi:hypothetical protein
MAGDWVKIRTDLYRDPKVSTIVDELLDDQGDLAKFVNQMTQRDMAVTRNVMRNVTVGALVAVWGVTRHRGKRVGDDLVLPGTSLQAIDDIADLPGFGLAMSSVSWLTVNEDELVFPRFFTEFNSEPAKSDKEKAAERQRRYRAKRNGKSDVTRDVTVAQQSDARIEESREEKSIQTYRPDDSDSGDFLAPPPDGQKQASFFGGDESPEPPPKSKRKRVSADEKPRFYTEDFDQFWEA